MKKQNIHIVRSGWGIIEPHTKRFFRGLERQGNTWPFTSRLDEAYLGKSLKDVVEIARHFGKGRTMTVAKTTISYDINYEDAVEVTGMDSARI